jgi:MOSC domain-containing protein YiiM
MHICHLNIGNVKPLTVNGRRINSAIGKRSVTGPLPVGNLGLAGDEQADPTVHGGLSKALYAYPQEHMAYWQEQRRTYGSGLFADLPHEALPPGFMGENLSLSGLLESDVWVGDTLHFAHCVLRVTEPRQPCGKFNAVMGFAQAGKCMAQTGFCGFYLAVEVPGTLQAGEPFALKPGSRRVGIAEVFASKRAKHLR